MVWLLDENIVEFPKFEFFLQCLSESVQDDSRVFDAFLKWSTLDVQTALTCLSYGTYPIIRVPKLFGSAHSHGHFRASEPNYITIRRDKIQDFDKGTVATRVYEDGKYLEMLILHELVHWGRHAMSRVDDEEDPDSGRLFAMEAYQNVAKPHIK